MSGSGAFRYKLFPVPKGKHLSPHLPSQTEDALWHHFLEGEFPLRGAQGQGPQLRGDRESSSGKSIFQNEEEPKAGISWETPWLIQNSSSQSVVCGTLDVTETLSWDCWGESYFHSITRILFDFSLCWHLLWCITAVMETMVANLTSNYFLKTFL